MVEVSVEGDKAVFTVLGWDKLWALRSRLEVPLAHVRDVHADASPKMGWSQGLKVLGVDLPNVFRAGTFYQGGGWVFWHISWDMNPGGGGFNVDWQANTTAPIRALNLLE